MTWLSGEEVSWAGTLDVDRRPTTTQIDVHASAPSLDSRCGVADEKLIASPGPRSNVSKATWTRSRPEMTWPYSWPWWRMR